jgi:arginyl-tRNA--protein-N-Asp/Glu arginylyltransferase
MNANTLNDVGRLALYLTPEHACSYLLAEPARTLFIDPLAEPAAGVYQHLLELGFRRSGDHVYRPHCPGCQACVPVRLPVADFRPRRSQRRARCRAGHGLTVREAPARFDPVHYRLYQRYTASRHADGGMADADPRRYLEFLTTHWCPTRFVEFYHDGRLLAVAVTDQLPDALSAVYTFFDPDQAGLSPGVLCILWQIESAARRGLSHLYLGYWIGSSPKMAYKDQYRPLEAWNGTRWCRFGPGHPLE